jgi:serine protease Do
VRGVLVSNVTPGGPGDKAGMKSGDVILQYNGQDVNDPNILRNLVAATAPGTDVPVTIQRNGAQQQLHVRIGELSAESAASGSGTESGATGAPRLGLSVVPVTPQVASQLGLPRGVQGLAVQSVDPNGPAAQAGIQAGDVIEQVNRQPVRSAEDLRRALEKSSGGVPPVLLVNRNGQTVFVAVPLQ